MEPTPNDVSQLLENIYNNCDHNLSLNIYSIYNPEDCIERCRSYLSIFNTSICSNINNVKDKQALLVALQEEILEATWMLTALMHYEQETIRHLELDQEIKQLKNTESNEKKYTIKKQEKECN